MAKRTEEFPILELTQKAESSGHPDIYANHVMVVLTNTEFLIDFFKVSVLPGSSTELEAIHEQRIILPISGAKGLATAIANVIADHEEGQGVTLPNQREPREEDKITIWD